MKANILGNNLDCFKDYRELYDHTLNELRNNSRKGYVTVNNVHTIMEGFNDPGFRAIINNAFLSIPDGKPLEVVGKIKGHKNISRLFGPTVMEKFIDWGRKDNVSHLFFGSSEETLQKLRLAIESGYPGTEIVGMIAPPYKPAADWDNDYFIRLINESGADFIWVGLGAPKQERWMYDHHDKVKKGILFGIGAGFDYMAGHTKHAPVWMKEASLEWLYRLIQEPRRLWKRYFKTIPAFIFFASLEILGIQFRSRKKYLHATLKS